jgi:hypothetical protein
MLRYDTQPDHVTGAESGSLVVSDFADRMPTHVYRCGMGKCRICSCPSFTGGGNICSDCGHRYDDHATSPL